MGFRGEGAGFDLGRHESCESMRMSGMFMDEKERLAGGRLRLWDSPGPHAWLITVGPKPLHGAEVGYWTKKVVLIGWAVECTAPGHQR